jgi:cytochrome b
MRAPRYLGHNPVGAAMVIALLATLLVICITGVMMTSNAYWGVEWVDKLHATASTFALILIALRDFRRYRTRRESCPRDDYRQEAH